ncbi:MAG: hypothetical protein ACP5MG_05725 [Verrucomicrobiia bacterium]|jgi:hypothetical protein
MRIVLQIVSALAVVGLLSAPILFFNDLLTRDRVNTLLLICTLLWFISAPFWMERKENNG